MLTGSLTRRRSEAKGGRSCGEYAWRGLAIRACDDALCALEVSELMERPEGGDMPSLLRLLFPGELMEELAAALPADMGAGDLGELAISVCWDAFGMDISEDGRHRGEWEEPVMDFAEDAGRVRASLLMSYGLDWDECRTRLSYAQLCDLVSGLMEGPQETPLAQAIHYRTAKPPKREKWNRAEREAFDSLRRHYALGQAANPEARAAAASSRADDEFAAEMRAAEGTPRG